LAVAVAAPILKNVLAEWNPLQFPPDAHILEVFGKWRNLFIEDDQGKLNAQNPEPKGQMGAYDNMMYHIWLPKVRSSISNEWDAHEPETAVSLIDNWKTLIPKWMLENIFAQLIIPKLQKAVEEWNPRKDKTPIHLWIHPWLVHLGDALQPLYVNIRYKLSVALENWHPRDPSAHAMLSPWRLVFKKEDLDNLILKCIYPKLVLTLQEFSIDPANQSLDEIEWVMKWGSLIPASRFLSLWTNEFFPKWLNVLLTWLTNQPNYDEVTAWFLAWKELFPPELVSQPSISMQFTKGLDMMNQLVAGSNSQLKENIAKFRQSERTKMEEIKVKTDALKKKPRSSTELSIKEQLQLEAGQRDIIFIPSGTTSDGKAVYKFGAKQVYWDKEVVYVQFHGHWNTISLEDLIIMATQ